MQTRGHQFSYADKSGYVFLDSGTFEEVVVPAELIGNKKWLLKEGSDFPIRFIEGRVAEVVFPVNFVDEVVQTAAPTLSGHDSHVMKEAKLACGLTVLVPQFIKVGERVSFETETHKYLRREPGTS
jgi:elongation factor P